MIRDALRKAMGWNSGPKILAATIALIVSGVAVADTARDAAVKNDAAVKDDDGLYSDKNGAPTPTKSDPMAPWTGAPMSVTCAIIRIATSATASMAMVRASVPR